MITLTTKFHGPTNTIGARISCRAPGRPWRVFVSYDHGASDIEKHARALASFHAKHFSKHADEQARWVAYHYGHTDDGMSFTRLVDGDHVNDCVWINAGMNNFTLTDPTKA